VAAGQTTASITAPAWPGYSWRLPKTVLSATVTYTLTGCTMTAAGNVQPITKIKVDFKANGVPDTYLGPDLPDGWINVSAKDLSSFWSNTSITIETDASTRMLTHLVSAPVNQATTILGNAITAATKIAAASLGVPTAAGGPAAAVPCLDANAISTRITSNQNLLNALAGQTSKAAVAQQAALTKAINDDTKSITISFSCDIDPAITADGVDPPGQHCPQTPSAAPGKDPSHTLSADGRIAVIGLTTQDLKNTMWITGFNPADPKVDLSLQQIGIYLDFSQAHPEAIAQCPGGASTCSHHRVIAGKDTMYREVAYLNVSWSIVKVSGNAIVQDNSKMDTPPKPVLFPFAQFGIPRTVALTAGFAQSPNWDITMNTFGEMGASKAGTVATGLGLSSLLGNASGGASAILTEIRSSESTVDPTLQGQVATAQALYNLANAQQQLLQLCAKTYMPGVCPAQ
jgi:hypothetical protein